MNHFLQKTKAYLRPAIDFTKKTFRPLAIRWRAFAVQFPRFSRVVKWGSIAGFTGLFALFAFVLMVYWGAFTPIPTYGDLNNIKNYNASEIYSSDGALLGNYYFFFSYS